MITSRCFAMSTSVYTFSECSDTPTYAYTLRALVSLAKPWPPHRVGRGRNSRLISCPIFNLHISRFFIYHHDLIDYPIAPSIILCSACQHEPPVLLKRHVGILHSSWLRSQPSVNRISPHLASLSPRTVKTTRHRTSDRHRRPLPLAHH